jgi:hypothetical protein
MGENEVKSLLFIIVVIVYLQYLEEREVERNRSFATYTIRLANRFSLLSCDHFRNIPDVHVPIAKVSSLRSKPGKQKYSQAGKTPRPAAVSGGDPNLSGINKQGQALRIADLHPKLTRLLNYPPPKKVIRYHRAWLTRCPPHAHARTQNTLAPYSPASCMQLRGKSSKSGEK